MIVPILNLEIRQEQDVVLGRQRARQIADYLGFLRIDQTRIATAVSEIARNAFQYAAGGKVEFLIERGPPAHFEIRISERGQGIDRLKAILDGRQSLETGMGIGIIGARRLMDRFEIQADSSGGAMVVMTKSLPRKSDSITTQELARMSLKLSQHGPPGLLGELEQQNQELIRALEELRERQAEIAELHRRELDDTNRGVVALYAELDENAQALRRISELKSRFLSNMSHEFRSPLNTILGLSGFLLARSDGDLAAEQEKQVKFIRKAAEGLAGLVNDLLDLAKVEAGKAVVHSRSFEIGEVLENLRGTIRPLLSHDRVSLVFEDPPEIPTLQTDEGKLSQILRNLLSNAVKYTETGEIRVAVSLGPADLVVFSVSDTGIGIAAQDQEHIFEEFGQVESPLQARIKGTGLGLPLSRKLAGLLGGTVSVKSEPGVGSTFFAVIPRVFHDSEQSPAATSRTLSSDRSHLSLLIVEDDPVELLLYAKAFEDTDYRPFLARTIEEARRFLGRVRPVAVLLDTTVGAKSGWDLLAGLKRESETKSIPVIVVTNIDERERARRMGASEFLLKPIDRKHLLDLIKRARRVRPLQRVLIIDDSDNDRQFLRGILRENGYAYIDEVSNGTEGIQRATELQPDVIFLDMVMPDMMGSEVLKRLREISTTREIPVIINTSKDIAETERAGLLSSDVAILTKQFTSRDQAFQNVQRALMQVGARLPSQAPEADDD